MGPAGPSRPLAVGLLTEASFAPLRLFFPLRYVLLFAMSTRAIAVVQTVVLAAPGAASSIAIVTVDTTTLQDSLLLRSAM